MYNVIQLLAKYGAHILFVVLEIICFSLIINYNKAQKDIFINSSNVLTAKIADQQNQILQFTRLKNQNDSLMIENANLIENLISIDYASDKIPNRSYRAGSHRSVADSDRRHVQAPGREWSRYGYC